MIVNQLAHPLLGLLAAVALSLPASALTLEGKTIQGGLLRGQVDPGDKVSINGKAVRVSRDGRFIVGFGRDHEPAAKLVVTHADGSTERRPLRIEPREYRIQRIDGLPKNKVSKFSDKALEQIRADTAATREARTRDDARHDWDTDWMWPTTGRISGVYGSQRILNGNPRRPHYGIDIAVPRGTPVRAPADGIVTLVRDMYFSGITVILDHGHMLSSAFLHLSKSLVRVGDEVKQGAIIAEVGSTGRSTGPHLDWRINLGSERLDPQFLVPPMPKQAKR